MKWLSKPGPSRRPPPKPHPDSSRNISVQRWCDQYQFLLASPKVMMLDARLAYIGFSSQTPPPLPCQEANFGGRRPETRGGGVTSFGGRPGGQLWLRLGEPAEGHNRFGVAHWFFPTSGCAQKKSGFAKKESDRKSVMFLHNRVNMWNPLDLLPRKCLISCATSQSGPMGKIR